MTMLKNINEKVKLALFSVLISSISILIFSQNSPLYPMNIWDDVNVFFTVGRSLNHDIILYKEIYDQKGPLLFFIYKIISKISENSFIGVYIFEALFFCLFVYFSSQIACMYEKNRKHIYFYLVILSVIIPTSHAFSKGGSVEEMFLFTFVLSLYLLLKDIKYRDSIHQCTAFIIGLLSSFVFWIKYTALGFYLGIIIFVIVYFFIKKEKQKSLFKLIGFYLLGFLIITIPILLYFIVNNALQDLFTAYFYNNIFNYNVTYNQLYGNLSNIAIVIINFCRNIFETLIENYLYNFFVIFGIVYIIIKCQKVEKLLLLFSFFGLLIFTYAGGINFSYYGLVISSYSVFGLTFFGIILHKILNKIKSENLILVVLTITIICFGYKINRNTFFIKYKKEDLPQYRFAKIINSDNKHHTLLNYDGLDSGFYYASGIIPTTKYFCSLNVNRSEILDIHNKLLEKGEVDYIVCPHEVEFSKYNLISKENLYYYEDTELSFYLYKLKE